MVKGIIYLIQPAELIGTNRYKIGCSSKPNLNRCIRGYKKNSRYLHILECNEPFKLEKEILLIFKQKFKLIAGNEYFEGDEHEICDIFINIVKKFETTYLESTNQNITMNKKNKNKNKNLPLIDYLIENNNTTNPLQIIDFNTFIKLLGNIVEYDINYKQIIDENKLFNLTQILINNLIKDKSKENKFIKIITQIILKYINHGNDKNQQIYSIDCVNYNYVIKIDENWIKDKSGIIFNKYIIKPIIHHLKHLLKKYKIKNYENQTKLLKYMDNDELIETTYNYEMILLISIQNIDFITNILKEVSPYLKHIKKNLYNINISPNINENNTESESDVDTESELEEEKIEVKPKKIIKQKKKVDSSSEDSDSSCESEDGKKRKKLNN